MISRRIFFQSVAAGAVVLPWVELVASETDKRPSLGFSLYGMKTLPLDVALRTCAQIGYSHVELAMNSGYVTEPAVFSQDARRTASALLRELKLALPCLMVHLSLTADSSAHAQNLQIIRAASQVAHDLVPENPPILETILGGSPAKWDEQKSGMADELADWARAAEQSRTSIALKSHVGSAVNSPERLLWLLNEVKSPSIHAAYDYSHFELRGLSLDETLKSLIARTKFIHVKDSMGDAAKFQFLLPGQGRTDYVKYFSLLRQYQYSGPVCVEVSGQIFNKPNYDAIVAAKQSYQTLSMAMYQAFR